MIYHIMNVNFWLRRQRVCRRPHSSKYGKCPIMYYVVTGAGESASRSHDVHMGYYCAPADWDAGRWPADALEAKKKLEAALTEINARYEAMNIPATGEMLLTDYLNKNKPARYMLVVAQEYVDSVERRRLRGKIKNGTFRAYKTRLENLRYYVEEVLGRRKLTLYEVNNAFMMAMEEYFRDEYVTRKGSRRGLGVLTLKQQVHFLTEVMTYAVQRDYITQNPVSVYAVDTSDWQKNLTYLTQDELERLSRHFFLDPKTQEAVDAFIFLAETGISFVDYKRMRDDWVKRLGDIELPSDIRDRIDPEELWLIDARQKTGVPFAVPLSKQALRLLEQYGGAGRMPQFAEVHDLNVLVRCAAQMCGIDKYLTSRIGRKTFSHHWRNRSGLSSKATSLLMGHATDGMVNYYSSVQIEAAVRELYRNR
ncbi:phage integrase SAM-like domain-containing protein [Larkinella soli]|uniref:phage integrase SAM-like domain-containing protein n=1 Tax=Larkinella soli TaxID=1770527 RepID=UPI000FFB0951|nr:phage integrase SAM-like domain-containing protein [Larkinella soli]